MKRSRACGALAASIWLTAAAGLPVLAVSVKSWEPATAEEFARGSFSGMALDEDGQLRLGPVFETLWGPESGVVWDVSVDPEGGAVFAALSGPARVLRVARNGDVRAWYEQSDTVLVTAVATARDGVLFGVSPDGKVMRASTPGQAETVVETGAKFVWTLLSDGHGDLWVGTGSPGKLLRRREGRDAEAVFDSGDDPIRSLAELPGGGVVAGTGDRGRVIRFDREGKPFVIHDAEESEIVSLAVAEDGTVFALAAGAGGRRQPPTPGPAPVGDRVTVRAPSPPEDGEPEETTEEPPSANGAPGPRRPTAAATGAGGALYRIEADGAVHRIWSVADGVPYSVAVRGGRLLVATGGEGRLFELTPEGRQTALLRFTSDEVVSLAAGPDGEVFVGGAADARIARIAPGPAPSGWFESEPLDAGVTARWGVIRWDASVPPGAGVRVEVRTGNSEHPDETWSAWAAAAVDDAADGAPVPTPDARWLQARVRMNASTEGVSPVLRRISLFYLPDNRSPVIERLEVEPVGVAWTTMPIASTSRQGPLAADDPVALRSAESLQPKSRPARVIKGYEVGARTFTWSANDPDGDTMSYSLEIRREGADAWFPLATEIEESFYSWDSRAMPDGFYRVRLRADDAPGNPNGRHRTDTRTSAPFPVDHTPPKVEAFAVERRDGDLWVRFEAHDPEGRVDSVEFALDGGEWLPLDPLDGVADTERERYRLRVVPGETRGDDRHLMIRVTDSAGNLGGDMRRLSQ